MLHDYCDGEFVRNHPLVKNDDETLIGFYFDDLETANPFGSRRGKNKLGKLFCNFVKDSIQAVWWYMHIPINTHTHTHTHSFVLRQKKKRRGDFVCIGMVKLPCSLQLRFKMKLCYATLNLVFWSQMYSLSPSLPLSLLPSLSSSTFFSACIVGRGLGVEATHVALR